MNKIASESGGLSQSAIEKALELDRAGRGKRGRRRVVLAGLALLALLGAAVWASRANRPAPVAYQTGDAAVVDMVIEVSATGTLNPVNQVEVSSELSGVIREVAVEENARVAKGDVLARLDTARLSAQVKRAGANLRSAEAQLESARVSLKDAEDALARARALADRQLLSVQDLANAQSARDRAASAILIADAAVAVATAELNMQETDLSKSAILAPIEGVILKRSADPGQTVAASLSAPVLFVIAQNLERMELEAAIDEADVGQVAIGQRAVFTVDAWPGRKFTAAVSAISWASTTTDGVVSYKATFAVDNGELLLRPGMTATVEIVVREAKGVLAVPNAAFRFSPPKAEEKQAFSITRLFVPRFPRSQTGGRPAQEADGRRTVHVLENGVPVARRIRTGDTDGTRTEVTDGLKAGEAVVLSIAQGARG
jgi:HlyD family secretion protein